MGHLFHNRRKIVQLKEVYYNEKNIQIIRKNSIKEKCESGKIILSIEYNILFRNYVNNITAIITDK